MVLHHYSNFSQVHNMNKPTQILIIIFLLIISMSAYSQAYEECQDAQMNPFAITTFQTNQTISIDPAWTMDSDYLPSGLSDNVSTAYWAFTVNSNMKYDFSFTSDGANEIGGPVSIGFKASCPVDFLSEIYLGELSFTATNVDCNELTSSTTYIFVFAVDQGNEGDITFNISQATPSNDECTVDIPSILTVDFGTTHCADGEWNFCDMTTTEDHQVFYQYTNLTGSNVDLQIDIYTINGLGNEATDISMLVLSDDCSSSTVFPGTSAADYCSILDAGVQEICCIEAGETVIIVLGSAEGNEGDFIIANSENTESPVDNNDECYNNLDITPTNNNEWSLVDVNLASACPEDFIINGGCSFDVDPTVWYFFNAPNIEPLELYIQNISGDGYLTILETIDNCDVVTLLDGASCLNGAGPHGPFTIAPNTAYFIPFAGATSETYSFEFQIAAPPSNDDCENAIDLGTAGISESTTIGATQENPSYNSDECTDNDETNTVWFTCEVPDFRKGFGLSLDPLSPDPLMGDINIVVFDDFGCVFGEAVGEVCTNAANYLPDFECIGPGFYTIRLSSSEANAGNFIIAIETYDLVQDNDYCDTPDLSLNLGLECEWIFAIANTSEACPEDEFLDPSGCGLSTGPVVWYEITAPDNATSLDLQINSGGGSNPFMAVFPGNPVDCDIQSFVPGTTCFEGLFTDLASLGEDVIQVTGSEDYLIAIGVTDPGGAMIDFGIKWIVPPINDECEDAIALVANVAMDGTTGCATQSFVGEYNSAACVDVDEENTVWYTYEVPATDKGFYLTITAGAGPPGFTGDVNIVVFEQDSIGSCIVNGETLVDEICTSSAVLNEEFECVGPGSYAIRVSTSGDNEGEFTILIEPQILEQPNDNCDAPDVASFAGPLENEWITTTANTIGACPEDIFLDPTNCGFDDFPVVWFEATAPATALFLDLQIILNGGSNPFIAVFPGNPVDCDNQTFLAGTTCYEGLFNDLNETGQTQISVIAGSTYLIAIGSTSPIGSLIDFSIKWVTSDVDCPNGENVDDPCDDEDICTINDTIDEDCNCVGTFQDSDSDGTCDAEDVCDGGPEPGTSCDDEDACTIDDTIDEDCNCIGIFQDSDEDGTCDAEDVCEGGPEPGTSCDDEDACTIDDMIDEDCNCVGVFQDSDEDGVCDADDICEDGPEPGTPCDDEDICTINDMINEDCLCIGEFQDIDMDGTCDAEDICEGGPELGTACDDENECTIDDVINEDCLCIGEFQDSDFDGTCDAEDVCDGGPEPGTACDDEDACTIDDVINEDCICIGIFQDSDEDGVCDADDICEDGPEPGSNCDDEDDTTFNDQITPDCICEGTTDSLFCPGLDLNIGDACDDGDVCTVDDTVTDECECIGTFIDSDEDGTCDADDLCPDGPEPGTLCDDNNNETQNDQINLGCICEGIVDSTFCVDLEAYIGDNCNDNDTCTINDVIDMDCNCIGEFQDSDEDGTCDAEDVCEDGLEPGTLCDDLDENTMNDQINENCECVGESDPDYCVELELFVGDPCDDGDICTVADSVSIDCICIGEFQDSDNDNVCNAEDNCPGVANEDQLDNDEDGIGDVCDTDDDNDGILDVDDNCPFIENEDQLDSDMDGIGDACDVNSTNNITFLNINFYPNPARADLFFDSDDEITFRIIDINGILILQSESINQRIDVSDLQTGLYFIEYFNKDHIFSFDKILKI